VNQGGARLDSKRFSRRAEPRRALRRELLLLSFGLLLVVFLDVVVHAVGEFQVFVDVAAIGVLGIGQDREILLALPLQDSFASRRAVAAGFELLNQRASLLLREVRCPSEAKRSNRLRR
jgi:hypothetical protein